MKPCLVWYLSLDYLCTTFATAAQCCTFLCTAQSIQLNYSIYRNNGRLQTMIEMHERMADFMKKKKQKKSKSKTTETNQHRNK
jgi:hypothetical protein